MLSDTEFKGEGPALSGSRPPLLEGIAVGGGPSGPSIEGPFCRAVHLCRALGDRKIEKKAKKSKKITKKEGKIEKRRKRNE